MEPHLYMADGEKVPVEPHHCYKQRLAFDRKRKYRPDTSDIEMTSLFKASHHT